MEIDDLRWEIESIRRSLSRLALPAPAWLPRSSELADYLNQLLAADVDEQLAHDISEKVFYRLTGEDTDDVLAVLRSEMESRLPARRSGARVICFAGAPGVGKTSTLVKVAAMEAIQHRRAVQVLSLDTWRVAAADQLRSFCAILGVGFQLVESASLLRQAIDAHAGKNLVLIDTAGVSPADEPVLEELKSALSPTLAVERHVVLPATLPLRDLRRVLNRFRVIEPTHLAFTQLDEASTYGAVYSLAALTNLAVSYVCDGQQIPEDIRNADAAVLTGLALPRRNVGTQHRAA
jgi:flagellar biosynthesis protein FlhF